MRYGAMFKLVLLSITVGCAPATDDAHGAELGEAEGALVGGHVASESEYPATVYLGGCTGVKVGPRHFLSAAHCFGPPHEPTLKVTAHNDASDIQFLTVESVTRHPEYEHCDSCAGDNSMNDFGLKPDAALIIVSELTPDIPVASIDPTPVQVGDAVTLTGYGCEVGVGQPSGPARLKVGDTVSQDPLTLDGAATSIPGGFTSSYGPARLADAPGLCPGDSGGPLYRTGSNLLVGINALVSFMPDTGLPYGNWFTRLDTESRYDVNAWLNALLQDTPPTQGDTPCAGICTNPTKFDTQFLNLANLGTGASCYESTSVTLNAGTCGGFASGREFSINGTALSCGASFAMPAKRNGGYCVKVGAGESAWAWLSTW